MKAKLFDGMGYKDIEIARTMPKVTIRELLPSEFDYDISKGDKNLLPPIGAAKPAWETVYIYHHTDPFGIVVYWADYLSAK